MIMNFCSVLAAISLASSLVSATPTPTTDDSEVPLASCTTAPWKTGSCCKVQKEQVDGFDQEQYAYKCDYDNWAYLLSGQAGFGCSSGAITICCTAKDGSIITPDDGSSEISIPSDFTCQGL